MYHFFHFLHTFPVLFCVQIIASIYILSRQKSTQGSDACYLLLHVFPLSSTATKAVLLRKPLRILLLFLLLSINLGSDGCYLLPHVFPFLTLQPEQCYLGSLFGCCCSCCYNYCCCCFCYCYCLFLLSFILLI